MRVLILILILFFTFSATAQNTQKNRERLLDFMVDNYRTLQEPSVRDFLKHCPQMQNTTGLNRPFCTSVYSNRRNFLDRISRLMGKIRNEDISHERALEVISCLPVSPPNFQELEDILRRLDARPDCSPMDNGDFKVSKFLLHRKSDGNYDAVVNLDFQQVSGSVSPAVMQNRINQCLSGFTPYFRTPSGETLNIRVMSPAEVNATIPIGLRPPARVVRIHQGITKDENGNDVHFRADAENYPDNIPCHTIVHESLHHLGLCDEYPETSTAILNEETKKTYKDAFSCRVVPSRNTVMARQVDAIAQVVPQKFACRCNNDSCRNSLRGTDENARHVREMLTLGDSYNTLPEVVKKHCKTDYLDPRVYSFNNPGKRAVLIANNEYSLKIDHRYLNQMTVPGQAPSYIIGRRLVDCNCNGDLECLRAIPEATEKLRNIPPAASCPPEMETLPSINSNPLPGESTGIQGDVLTIVTTPESTESLLLPNHFNRILYGDCNSGPTANYNSCASFAYRGTGDAECASRPAACSNDSFFLGGSEQ